MFFSLFFKNWFSNITEYKKPPSFCLYVIIMSRKRFRVNLHSIVCLNVKELLARSTCHIWSLSDSNVIRTHNHLVRKRTLNHLAKLAVCSVHLTLYVYHVTYAFQSESIIYPHSIQTIHKSFTYMIKKKQTIFYTRFFQENIKDLKNMWKGIKKKNIFKEFSSCFCRSCHS